MEDEVKDIKNEPAETEIGSPNNAGEEAGEIVSADNPLTEFVEETPEDEENTNDYFNLLGIDGIHDLFLTPTGRTFATLEVNGHNENYEINSKECKKWLIVKYFKIVGMTPPSEWTKEKLRIMDALAQIGGVIKPVYIRVAHHQSRVYIDLGNEIWDAVEISANGWQVISDPPVKFYRSPSMVPLPYPTIGVSALNSFKKILNIEKESDWILILAWLVGAHGPGPYPVLVLQGEQGTAKTFTSRLIRELIDPNAAPVRTSPRTERDLIISAYNSWGLSFDNLSVIKEWLSNAFCRLSTGGGFATRQLYTNQQEIIIDAKRPIIMNGIDEVVVRHDLLDRSIIINLPVIPEDKRRPERELWDDFELIRPSVLGALYDAVAMALQRTGQVKLESLPRLADFALMVVQAEPALPWNPGEFLRAFKEERQDLIESILDTDPLVEKIKQLMVQTNGYWKGRPTTLYQRLTVFDKGQRSDQLWPKNASALSRKLQTYATFLRSIGIEFKRHANGPDRSISLKRTLHNALHSNINNGHQADLQNIIASEIPIRPDTGRNGLEEIFSSDI